MIYVLRLCVNQIIVFMVKTNHILIVTVLAWCPNEQISLQLASKDSVESWFVQRRVWSNVLNWQIIIKTITLHLRTTALKKCWIDYVLIVGSSSSGVGSSMIRTDHVMIGYLNWPFITPHQTIHMLPQLMSLHYVSQNHENGEQIDFSNKHCT